MGEGFYGADTEQLRQQSDLLRNRAGTLTELRERLEPMVQDESAWRGSDAEQFRERWSSTASAAFDQLGERLRALSADLERQAQEQDDVSEADGALSLGDLLSAIAEALGGAASSVWNVATQIWNGPVALYNKAQGIFSGGKKIWDAVKQWISGEYKEVKNGLSGWASKLLGKLGLPTGFGPKNFFSKLDDIVKEGSRWLEKAPWLSKVARGAARALPGLDILFGGMQVWESVQKGDTFHAITGGVQTLGGILVTAGTICDMTGVGAVVGVPLQAVGGILVGGAAIADGAKWAVDNWGSITDTAGKAWDATTSFAGDMGQRVGDAASDAAETVSDTVSDIGSGLKHAFGF